jgi:hypothetical protein
MREYRVVFSPQEPFKYRAQRRIWKWWFWFEIGCASSLQEAKAGIKEHLRNEINRTNGKVIFEYNEEDYIADKLKNG